MTIKKFLLSFLVIASFGAYTFVERTTGQGQSNFISANNSQQNNQASQQPLAQNISYKDGEFTGQVEDAYYGNVQVKAIIQNGKITDVQFLDYPQDRRTSIEVNSQATPILKQEAIQAQSANVDTVSGATATSEAFIKSLQTALAQAQS